MPRFDHEQRLRLGLAEGGQWLRAALLQAAGGRPVVCDYCGSAIPVGTARCHGCGATASGSAPKAAPEGSDTTANRHWVLPLLLCVLFPPALLVVIPIVFWRWLRRGDRGWIVPLLVCLLFPPAVLLVAPALLWRPTGSAEAR